MSQFDNINAVRKAQTYRLLGSFWNNAFGEKDQARTIVDLDFRNQLMGSFEAVVANLAGNTELGRRVVYTEYTFKPSSVFEAGMLVFDDPDKKVVYGTDLDAEVTEDDFRIKYYVLALQNVIPIKIQSKDRALILGTDFFFQKPQWIYFRDDPRLMFPSGVLPVVEGWKLNYYSYMSYLTRVRTDGNDDLVVDWLRNLQTTKSFKLALSAVAKLAIIRVGGQLLSFTVTHSGDTIYEFPDEVVRVSYRHDQLQVGTIYEPDTVIGDVIQMFSPQEKKVAWWRQIDWRGGILLDPILPAFHNIPLLDQDVPAYTAGQDLGSFEGSKVHARLQLSSNFDLEVGYWDQVQANEIFSGIYLNHFLNLEDEVDGGNPLVSDTFDKLIANWRTAQALNAQFKLELEQPQLRTLPTAKLVNALDTFFRAYLGDTAMVITLDMSRLSNILDTFAFLSREGPAGAVLIIIGYFSDHPAEDVGWNTDILVEDSVTFNVVTPVEVTEDIDLGLVVADYVDITPIIPGP